MQGPLRQLVSTRHGGLVLEEVNAVTTSFFPIVATNCRIAVRARLRSPEWLVVC